MKKFALLAIVCLSPVLAHGAVTLNMANGQFYKNDGATPLSDNSTFTIIGDPSGDGFGDLTQAVDSWTFGDDLLLFRGATNDFLGSPGTSFDAITFGVNTGAASPLLMEAGEKIMIVFYDKAFSAADTGPGNDVFFGSYRSDSTTDREASFSDITWVVPSDGFTVNLNFLTQSQGGSLAESFGRASLKTIAGQTVPPSVPEPSSGLLVLLASALAGCKSSRVRSIV